MTIAPAKPPFTHGSSAWATGQSLSSLLDPVTGVVDLCVYKSVMHTIWYRTKARIPKFCFEIHRELCFLGVCASTIWTCHGSIVADRSMSSKRSVA